MYPFGRNVGMPPGDCRRARFDEDKGGGENHATGPISETGPSTVGPTSNIGNGARLRAAGVFAVDVASSALAAVEEEVTIACWRGAAVGGRAVGVESPALARCAASNQIAIAALASQAGLLRTQRIARSSSIAARQPR